MIENYEKRLENPKFAFEVGEKVWYGEYAGVISGLSVDPNMWRVRRTYNYRVFYTDKNGRVREVSTTKSNLRKRKIKTFGLKYI